MRKMILAAALAVATLVCVAPAFSQTQTDLQKEIDEIRQQLAEMDSLKARLDELEKKLNESEKAREEMKKVQEANAPVITTGFKGVKAKIDGRIFAGIFSSGAQGSYPNWSTDIPDAKLRFTFYPSKNITIVNRLSASGTTNLNFDYFYIDFARTLSASNIIRLGQRKIDVGQETWVDNPEENMLITTSVSNVSGYGIGLAAVGRFSSKPNAPLYELGFVDGPKGVTPRPSTGLPVNAKIGSALSDKLFASASYFRTGHLGASNQSAISVAGLSNAPTGATSWSRNLWEVDLRYGYGPTGIRYMIPTGKLPPLMLGATYGRFFDNAEGAADRNGSYWFVEALATINPKLYAATRYSVSDLTDSSIAPISRSPIAVNSYRRTSIGIGYALTDLVQWKMDYTFNDTSGGTSEPSLNQWATGIAARF